MDFNVTKISENFQDWDLMGMIHVKFQTFDDLTHQLLMHHYNPQQQLNVDG
jgi:hypothetical protein